MTDSPLSADLIKFGAVYTPAEYGAGQSYWQLVKAEGPMDIGGNHSIFVEVLGGDGQRAVGVRVRFWNGGTTYKATEAKPGENYAVDFPIFAADNAYGVSMADGLPTDVIFGMGLVKFQPHKSYHLTFHLVMGQGVVNGPPVIVPQPGIPPVLSAKEAIRQARELIWQGEQLIDYALGLLP